MKTKILLLALVCLFTNFTSFAQAPQGIPYQAAARSASGDLITNQNISVRFTIHDNTAAGTTVYRETHAVTTNALGLFSVNVGEGTPVSGTLSGVDWGSGAKFLEVELDPAGGTSYTSMGTNQMMSVPYALFAAGSGDAIPGGTAPGNTLYWNGSQWVADSNIHNNGGNVGVGTSSPNEKLQINDFTATGPTYLKITTKGVNESPVGPKTSGIKFRHYSDDYGFTIKSIDESGISAGGFMINSLLGPGTETTRFFIHRGTGNVGIGTSNPIGKLDVAQSSFSNLDGGLVLRSATSSNRWNLYTNNSLSDAFRIAYNGNVRLHMNLIGWMGLNTTSPTQMLDVNGQVRIRGGSPGAGKVLTSDASGTASWQAPAGPSGSGSWEHLAFWTSANNLSYINDLIWSTSTNRLGLGTFSPTQKLDVNGQIRIRGGSPGAGKVLTSDATGTATWQTPAAIVETDPQVGSNSTSRIPRWNGSQLVTGSLYDNGGRVSLNSTSTLYAQFRSENHSNGTWNYGSIHIAEGSGTNNIGSYGIAQNATYSTGIYGYARGSFNYGVYGNGTYYAGYFAGDVYSTGNYLPSDERLKSNIQSLENALAILSDIKVYTYNYNNEKYKGMNLQEGQRFGFMASNMKQVLPQLTKTTRQQLNPGPIGDSSADDEYVEFDAVNYTEMIPILTKALQEQQVQIEQLKAEIESLKKFIR